MQFVLGRNSFHTQIIDQVCLIINSLVLSVCLVELEVILKKMKIKQNPVSHISVVPQNFCPAAMLKGNNLYILVQVRFCVILQY